MLVSRLIYYIFKDGFHLALTSGNCFLAKASELEYDLVSARWKPCFIALTIIISDNIAK